MKHSRPRLLKYYLNVFVLPGTSKLSISDNVKLMSWLPQNDILGHPKTRLLVGHAGLNGILESSYHAVPTICSPVFGDHFDNALAAKRLGFAEIIDLKTISSEDLVILIRKVLSQPRWVLCTYFFSVSSVFFVLSGEYIT